MITRLLFSLTKKSLVIKRFFLTLFFAALVTVSGAQSLIRFADSTRIQYQIPELAYAVVSADSIFALEVLGEQRYHTGRPAKLTDRFHIGSNTKAITSIIAALLVKQGQIKWDTKFIDLFPELKATSRAVYQKITLQDLLSFRGKLPSYSYTNDKPVKKQITGTNAQQRLQLATWFLSKKPMKEQNGLTPSNADYILAGLMLEKTSGKSYKELVGDFGKMQGIDFGFDYPNLSDSLQTWGHDVNLRPVAPYDNYKLNWLLTAGNINVSLPGYIKFIQLLLRGLDGNSNILSKETFNHLLYGLPIFSFGWFNKVDPSTNHHVAYNEGNAGAFITQVQVIKEAGKAYIIFTNAFTKSTSDGIAVLLQALKKQYGE